MADPNNASDFSNRPDNFAEDIKGCSEYERPFLEAVRSLPSRFAGADTNTRRAEVKSLMVSRLNASKLSPESLTHLAAEYYSRLITAEEALKEMALAIAGNKDARTSNHRELFGIGVELLHKGARFHPKRKKGAIQQPMKYIKELAQRYPTLSAKELFARADKGIIGEISSGTFANKVSQARNVKK